MGAMAWFVAGCLLAQAGPPAADLEPAIARLVRQFDAADKATRDQAEAELLELGTPALALLPTGDDASAEARLRLARVRVQLEKLRAEEQVAASRVTLAGQDLPLADVLAAFEKQTGNTLIDYREPFGQQADEQKLKLAFEATPFWPALDQVLDQAKFTIYGYGTEPGLALVKRGDSELPRYERGSYAGAFRIEATEVTARRDPRNPASQVLKVLLDVAWEPRLHPISLSQSADTLSGVGDQGQALSPAQPEGDLEVSINPGATACELPLLFALPPRSVQRIATLRGQLAVLLPGPVETFRFEKLAAGAKGEQRRAGVRVFLEQVRRNNLVWEIRVRVVFDKADQALESHRTWVLHNEALLESSDKTPIPYASLETTRQTPAEVGVAYYFDVEDVADHAFVYKTPAVIMNAAVRYELSDVLLP